MHRHIHLSPWCRFFTCFFSISFSIRNFFGERNFARSRHQALAADLDALLTRRDAEDGGEIIRGSLSMSSACLSCILAVQTPLSPHITSKCLNCSDFLKQLGSYCTFLNYNFMLSSRLQCCVISEVAFGNRMMMIWQVAELQAKVDMAISAREREELAI